ncbi:uncharacterized protein LOC110036301 [Phalaenopsis equestris]|uniref:uncharacterized protein LOC110036301 n=1 Tax=Phalaenopsis equestris TaxID=78828 RepID=UPI0009E56BB1|nr:uncharacterized protein LOC110036301 [Phalaenopsis equestris]
MVLSHSESNMGIEAYVAPVDNQGYKLDHITLVDGNASQSHVDFSRQLSDSGRHLTSHLLEANGSAPFSHGLGSLSRNFSCFPFGENTSFSCVTFTPKKCEPSLLAHAHFSTETNKEDAAPPESVQEIYTKLLKSVEAKTMPPNALLWSLIEKCSNKEDINLLFQILQRLRVFRLSSLRIHANFNCHLCLKVTEACIRSNALEYGMKALWKHNVYGLTPSISSAHRLLLHAKEHNDVKLMEKIMDVLKKNLLPLQPGTADIVFSICYNANNWELLSKYAKRFLKAGVKLHRPAYDNLMEFAAKMGDSKSIWKTEQHRSKHLKWHTFGTGFACAKAYLIERKPDSAAAVISHFYQELPDAKKPYIADEVQKLVSEWPSELIRTKMGEDKEDIAESLRSDLPVMVSSLRNLGVDVTVDLGELKC